VNQEQLKPFVKYIEVTKQTMHPSFIDRYSGDRLWLWLRG
jgi:hypothetical protein